MTETTPINPAPAPSAPASNGASSIARRITKYMVTLVVVACIIGAFVWWDKHDAKPKAGVAAPAAPPPPEVLYVVARSETIPFAPRYLGRTEASQTVEIRTRIDGFLDERLFEEGTKVQKSQALFQIEPQPYQNELDIASAQLESARAQAQQSQRQLERIQSLVQGGGGNALELDQAETDKLVTAAAVHLAESRLAKAKLDVDYTSIQSPITGMIGRSQKDVGTFVQAGASGLLATVQQVDPIYVTFSVSEQEVLQWQEMVARGTIVVADAKRVPLSLELLDGSNYPFNGVLNFFSVQIDPTTGTALGRGEFPNPDDTLRPGQFVRVTARGIERVSAMIVPQRALMLSPTGTSVYVINQDDTIELRLVKSADWVRGGVIIEHGLKPGDRVALDSLMTLRPGTKVVPKLVTPEPASGAASPAVSPSMPHQPGAAGDSKSAVSPKENPAR